MKFSRVYCLHSNWDSFGPNTVRCYICGGIWNKDKDAEPPKILIGYIEDSPEEETST